MIEYKIITATPGRLEQCVATAIADGWEPLGGVCSNGENLLQAMIRRTITQR